MTEIRKQDRPDYRCDTWERMRPAQEIARDVKGGTLRLRQTSSSAAGANGQPCPVSKYLPKFPAEHPDDYRNRLNTAVLFNAYGRTVLGSKGLVFKKNPALSADVPLAIRGRKQELNDDGSVKTPGQEGHWDNIDLAGTRGEIFCQEVFESAFDGHCFVLVDMPPALGPGATLEDELRAGLRPFWVKYEARQAVNFMPVIINGRKEIGQLTFEEETSERDGEFGERTVLQYRIFSLVEFVNPSDGRVMHRVLSRVQKKVKGEDGKDVFIDVGEPRFIKGPGGDYFDRIPVAVTYGRKVAFLESEPPRLDLALLCVKYFQKESDRDQSEHKCGNPIPIFKVADPDNWKVRKAGAGLGIAIGKDEEAEYLEPQGVALEETRKTLEDLRAQMATLGLSMLVARPQVSATATESVIDFAQESSELEMMAGSAAECFTKCLGFHARYLGEKGGGTVSLGSHLKALRLTPQMIQVYSNMAAQGDLSRLTLWDILLHADALPEDFEAQTEKQRLDEQRKEEQDNLGAQILRGFNSGPPPNPGAGADAGGAA